MSDGRREFFPDDRVRVTIKNDFGELVFEDQLATVLYEDTGDPRHDGIGSPWYRVRLDYMDQEVTVGWWQMELDVIEKVKEIMDETDN
jgi:hypothetical protein